jgi:hypothetical protein
MDSDPDVDPHPAVFIIGRQDANKKKRIKKKFFCILLFEGTFTSFFKNKTSKRSHKTIEIKVFFFLCLLNDRRIRFWIQEAQKHVDPVDPDPQHWLCNVWARTVRNLSGHFATFIIRICCTFLITMVKGLFYGTDQDREKRQ